MLQFTFYAVFRVRVKIMSREAQFCVMLHFLRDMDELLIYVVFSVARVTCYTYEFFAILVYSGMQFN